MDRINKTNDELLELDLTLEGVIIKELLVKINEIVEWINGQS